MLTVLMIIMSGLNQTAKAFAALPMSLRHHQPWYERFEIIWFTSLSPI